MTGIDGYLARLRRNRRAIQLGGKMSRVGSALYAVLAGLVFASACSGGEAADDPEDTPSAKPSASPAHSWAWLAERAGNYEGGPIVPTPKSCEEIDFGPVMHELIGSSQPPEVVETPVFGPREFGCTIVAYRGADTVTIGGTFDEMSSGVDAPGAASTEKPRGKVFDSPAAEAAGGVAEFEKLSDGGRRVRYHLPGQWVGVWVHTMFSDPFTRDEMVALLDAMILAAAGRS